MKILAVETATAVGSVALVCHQGSQEIKVLGEITLYSEKSHSERLLSSIDFLLKGCGSDISEIDYFATSIGPGSFTGLRVGLSTVKAFAFAHQKKVVGVPTLEAMSLSGIFHEGPICSFLDAGRGELFAALYSVSEKGEPIQHLPVSLQKPNDLIFKLVEFQKQNDMSSRAEALLGGGEGSYKEKICLVGDLSLFDKKLLDQRIFKWGDSSFIYARASQVAHIALNKIISGHAVDPAELVPLYIRLPQAEANFKLN